MEAFDSLEQPLCDYNESMDALPELWESESFEPSIAADFDGNDTFTQSNWPTGLTFSLMSPHEDDSHDGLCPSQDMVVLHDRLITDASVANAKSFAHSCRIDQLHRASHSPIMDTCSVDTSINLLANDDKPTTSTYSITIDCRGDIEISEDPAPSTAIKVESHSSDVDSLLSIKKEPASPRDRSASPELTESRKRPISLVNNQCPRERQIVKVKSVSGNGRLILARMGASSSHKSALFTLPPTPPSSTSSDSEGSLSPLREVVSPKLEIEEGEISKTNEVGRVLHKTLTDSMSSQRHPINSPLISYQPKGSTGVLQLTEEEKRTLIAEGYPVPTRLPLTKAEEKSLKKIRRKIKNKISAQESRRKKKEYMDTLERRAQVLADENSDYRQRLHKLESDNAALQLQLTRLKQLFSQQISNSDQYCHSIDAV